MPQGSSRPRPVAGAGLLLDLVRRGVATTKLELTQATGLARATVNDRLDLLLELGTIERTGPRDSTGGRRASAYAFNERAGVVLVAAMGASAIRFACCDLGGRVLTDASIEIDLESGPTLLLARIRQGLEDVLKASGNGVSEVRGTTIGVPGPVDFFRGQVVSPPIMTGWDRLDIAKSLELPYPGPVLVENDANLLALGEHRETLRDVPNVIFVKVGTGVGSGIIIFGSLYRGTVGGAGDIGHIPGPGLDDLCRCGNRGCVEAAAGGWALARDMKALGHEVNSTADVVSALRNSNPDALELVTRAGHVVGAAVADAVSLLTPSVVVLGGDVVEAHPRMLGAIRERVYSRSLPLATENLRIRLSTLRERAGVVGGAHLVLEYIFAPDTVDRRLEAAFASAIVPAVGGKDGAR